MYTLNIDVPSPDICSPDAPSEVHTGGSKTFTLVSGVLRLLGCVGQRGNGTEVFK